jgi:uncharacterized protein (DUF736 family)
MEETKMAEQYDNTNSFAMFKNEKGENEARPDYTGTVTLEGGKEMRMAAWVREAKSGVKYLSGRLSEPQVQASDASSNAVAEGADVPF